MTITYNAFESYGDPFKQFKLECCQYEKKHGLDYEPGDRIKVRLTSPSNYTEEFWVIYQAKNKDTVGLDVLKGLIDVDVDDDIFGDFDFNCGDKITIPFISVLYSSKTVDTLLEKWPVTTNN